MKKILTLALSVGLALGVFHVPAYALEPVAGEPEPQNMEQATWTEETDAPVAIAPFWASLNQIICNLSIDNSGKATISSNCYSWYATDKVYVTTTLQKITGAQASDITSWSNSGTGSAYNSGSYTVSRGTYRTKVVASVYNSSGAFIETVTAYSSTKTY